MNKKNICLLLFGVIFAVVGFTSCSDKSPIKWKEPVIESTVRQYLGKPEGDIYPEDLEGISSIQFIGDHGFVNQSIQVQTISVRDGNSIFNVETGASRTNQGDNPSSIVTLSDFAHFPDLERLVLYDMSFSRLEGVEKLSENEKLREFTLSFNSNLTTIDGIGKLNQITNLRLVGIPVSELSELAQLTSLNILDIEDVPLTSIEFLQEMQDLEILCAYEVPNLDWETAITTLDLDAYEVKLQDGTAFLKEPST